jgi:integrase
MVKLRQRNSVSAAALEYAILTAARTGEVIGASWAEIDLRQKLWTVPSERMKAGKEHRVPLSDRGVALLKSFRMADPKPNAFVFPGARQGKPLSNMALLEMVRGLRTGVTTHGFRSAFRDWAGDKTSFPRDVAEAALAHTVGNKTEIAYRRSDALDNLEPCRDVYTIREYARPS